MTIEATFRAGGLASGLDTNSIIDQLVTIEQRPRNMLKTQQDALRSQVSVLGSIVSRLSSLGTAAASLKTDGLVALQAQSSPSAFSVTPTSGGNPGRFAVQVGSLAAAARARSQAFSSAYDPVTGGTLDLHVQGTTTSITIADGMALTDVAAAINQSGAAVSATVLSNGTQSFLSLTNRDTGYPLTGVPGDALSLSETSTGVQGSPLSLALTGAASNASVTVDGLSFTRKTNDLSDVIPGVTLSLKATSSAPEDLVVGSDLAATQAKLQRFVDAYNSVQGALQSQLDVTPGAERRSSLTGDSVVRGLARALQRVVSTAVPGLGTVRTLADVGLTTARDGSLSITAETLSKAIARDPGSVNALFTTATNGLSAVVSTLVTQYTSSSGGLLTSRQNGLSTSISRMDDQLAKMDLRLATYKQGLINQFGAMETVVSGLKSIGNFLNQNFSMGTTGGSK